MRSKNQNNGILKRVLLGLILSAVSAILLAALATVFLDNESMQIDMIPYISFAIWIITSFLGAFVSGWAGEEKMFLRSVITSAAFYIIFLASGILVFDGIGSDALYGFLGCLIGLVAAVFLNARRGSAFKNRKVHKMKFK